MANTNVEPLIASAIATGAKSARLNASGVKSFQATGTTTAGAGAASIDIEGSNDQVAWVRLGTISLTLSTTAATDGFTSDDRFGYVRGNVTAISGTNATVSAYMGY